MRRLFRALCYASCALAALSCSPDPAALTQLMVVVDSDLEQLDSVRVLVDGMDDKRKTASAADLDDHPLPRSVALVNRGDKLGPITITVEGVQGGATIVSQRARVSFVAGRNMALRFDLLASCVAKRCLASSTCRSGKCVDIDVDEDGLEAWRGKPDKLDAGAAEGGDGGSAAGSGGAGAGGGGAGGRSGAGAGGMGGQGGAGRAGAGSGGMPPEGGSAGMPPAMCPGCAFDANITPNGGLSCEDNVCKLSCDTGHADTDKQIANGCEADVFAWKPSNFDPTASALVAATTASLTINCSAALDLGGTIQPSVQICGQTVQPVMITQANGGPELVAIAVRGLHVTTGSKFRFTGSRPLLIAVYGDANIEGELDVSAVGTTGATGSNTGCGVGTGVGGVGVDGSDASGGGGGGFGTKGGNGGKGDSSGVAGGVGGVVSTESTLSPLRGGCNGGAGGLSSTSRASGGAGGGALQISASGMLRVSGVIAAAGGGGRAAMGASCCEGDGGGGGGSGGAILLEGTQIVQTSAGWFTANGGGGGDGKGLTDGSWGADGAHASSTPAPGGGGYSSGAPGAAGEQAAGTPSTCALLSECGGGGGGGGIGRIVLRAASCTLDGGRSPSAMCLAHQN